MKSVIACSKAAVLLKWFGCRDEWSGIAKVYLANMVHKVVDTSIQLHGALGYSQDTPLARWYTQIRSQRLVDGPDEVHKWTIGRNVIKAYRKHGTTASAAGGDLL